jgi:hypothetical protein
LESTRPEWAGDWFGGLEGLVKPVITTEREYLPASHNEFGERDEAPVHQVVLFLESKSSCERWRCCNPVECASVHYGVVTNQSLYSVFQQIETFMSRKPAHIEVLQAPLV